MKNRFRGILAVGLVVACGVGALSARAAGLGVRDGAGLFSVGAVQEVDETIRKIQQASRKELLVETFAGVPEGRAAEYAQNREGFFSSFVNERARAERLDGVYVLVMKEPPPHRYRIQVGVGQVTRQRAFSPADRDELVRLLQASFREDQYDEGLRSGVAFVERTLRGNMTPSSAPRLAAQGTPGWPAAPVRSSSSSFSFGSVFVFGLFIVGGVLVISFLIRLLRGGMGGGGRGGLPGASGGRAGIGGGGFFSSLLGGIGGAMAGSWLYDQFTGGNARAADSLDSRQREASSSDVGGDFTSSGGDVDHGSSGGDFGGGGGDSGGGGGDA